MPSGIFSFSSPPKPGACNRAGFAFALDAQARSGIHAGWNTQVDGSFLLDASLPAALGAALLDDLARALAGGASAGDGEKSLLIGELAAPGASLARDDAGSRLCAGAIARAAEFLARDFDFGIDARCGFLEGQVHVVAQIGAALRAPAAASAREEILEAEEVAKNIVEVLEDGTAEVHTTTYTGKPGMTVGVVDLALLRIAEHTVGFGALAELHLCLGFIFRVAIRVPLERALAIGGFDFFYRGGARDA